MLAKFGSIVVDGRGSVAGVTYSRNGSGAYARARVKPVQPNTALQIVAKSIFSFVRGLWNSGFLTEAQRVAWRDYAAGTPWLNKLGEAITLNGNAMFIRTNIARRTAGLTEVDDAPTTFTLPSADDTFECTVDEANQQISVAFDDTREYIDEDEAGMSIFVMRPQNAGTNSFHGPERYAGVILGDSVTPLTSPQVFASPFVVTEGQKISCAGRIMRADGRVSRRFQNGSEVTA